MHDRPWLDHYDPGVPYTIDYPSICVPQMLAESASKNPDQPCTIFNDKVITYREMDSLTNRLAAARYQLPATPTLTDTRRARATRPCERRAPAPLP